MRVEPEPELPVDQAVAAIERAQGFVEPLRRRTEGMTWVLWGFVTFAAGAISAITPDSISDYEAGGWRRLVETTLWVPWFVIGLVGTRALTRIANVRLRGHDFRIQWKSSGTLGLLAGIIVIWLLFAYSGLPVPAALAILFIGSIWFVLGAVDPYGATREGRIALLTIGASILLGGIVFAYLTQDAAHEGFEILPLGMAATGGLIPIIGGLYQTLRG